MRLASLAALTLAACATAPRQPFPADDFARPGTGGPVVEAVESDGRVIFAGEGGLVSAAVARFIADREAAQAGGQPTGPAVSAYLKALDRALHVASAPRLELLRASTACEVALEDRALLAPDLVRAIEARELSLSAMLEAVPGTRSFRPGRSLGYPVEPPVVTSFFGLRDDPFDGRPRYHLGLDLEAGEGQPVLASADGVVVSSGWAGGHGNRVEVRHASGVVTGYSHLSTLMVRRGEWVRGGEVVGLAGHTGRATGPHVHFEVWRDGEPEDPLDLLPDRGAVSIRADVPRE